MEDIKLLLIDIVKEKEISNIILEYKYEMEWADDFRHYYETQNIFPYIAMLREIDEKFLELNKEYIIWQCVLQHKKLSSEFLDKYFFQIKKDNQIKDMLIFQFLSESLIEKYSKHFNDRDWYHISLKQKLSREFRMKHADVLCFYALSMNLNLL